MAKIETLKNTKMVVTYILFIAILVAVVIFHNKHNEKMADRTLMSGTLLLLIVSFFYSSGTEQFLEKQFHPFVHGGEILFVVPCMFVLGHAFSHTGLRERVEQKLPNNKWAPFVLIIIVGVLSMAVDNIAMTLIGAQLLSIFTLVHPAMYVNVVSASNAGGSPTITGDTTTFMIANAGHSTSSALIPALLTVVIIAFVAMYQQSHTAVEQKPFKRHTLNYRVISMMIVYVILGIASLKFLGNALYGFGTGAFFMTIYFWKHKHLWVEVKKGFSAGAFLALLIICVGQLDFSILPNPSHLTGFIGGLVSMFLDNIPVTQAMLDQGRYPDWGLVAYANGSFGSDNWWASSAGVAMCKEQPFLRNIWTWLKYSWWLIIVQPIIYWLSVWFF